jgi:hypothetical protein
VLLGASNLAIHLPTVVAATIRNWGGPVDFLAALGHGRSYGRTSCVLVRTLPGIASCELWSELSSRESLPTALLVTDIGNDLLYGESPQQICAWVERCLSNVARVCSSIVITQLPLDSLVRVGATRFFLMRTILFPKSRLQYEQALDYARELNDLVFEMASRWDAHVVEPMRSWYGFDPIHIRRSRCHEAWQTILSSWSTSPSSEPSRLSFTDHWQLCWLRPRRRRLFGIEQCMTQPAGVLQDGSRVSIY